MLYNAYKSLLYLHNLGQVNWCTVIEKLLYSCGMGHIWEKQLVEDENLLLLSIKETLSEKYMNDTMRSLSECGVGSKLRNFRMYKARYCMESYLLVLKNIKYVQILARFRLSSHNLRIETGRHLRPKVPAEKRLCLYCCLNEVENEVHFLLRCPSYVCQRNKLFVVCNAVIPNFSELEENDKFVELMSSKNECLLRALAQFILHADKKRCEQVL